MISSEVQRTLVKSPPELWAELSDPAALARHLGELGDVRITRTEPEHTVEWEAENTSGTVLIKPTGWGTKVTLSVTRELAALAGTPAEPDSQAEAEEIADAPEQPKAEEIADAPEQPKAEEIADAPEQLKAEAIADAPEEPEAEAHVEQDAGLDGPELPDANAQPVADPRPAAGAPLEAETAGDEADGLEPRRGFFARLFGRGRARRSEASPLGAAPENEAPTETELEQTDPYGEQLAPANPEPKPQTAWALWQSQTASEQDVTRGPGSAPAAAPAPATTEPVELEEPAATAQPALSTTEPAEVEEPASAAPDEGLAAELRAAEEVAAEEVTAALTAVLDRLGAAHHRPFSRS